MKINYKVAIDLGFEREPFPDSMFFDQYGYDCFLLKKKLHKNFYADWECTTREVKIIKHMRGNILGQMEVKTIEDLKAILNFIGTSVAPCKPDFF